MNALVHSFKRGLLAAGVLAGCAVVAPAMAATQAGMLDCSVAAGVGFVVGSNKPMTCVYHPDRGPTQFYRGSISRIGVDIGATTGAQIQWAVLTTAPMRVGSLAGTYAGPGGALTIGAGLGANALVGGNNQISLQPLSISTAQGLNVSAGIGAITLEPAPGPVGGPMRHHRHHMMHHHHHQG